MKAAVCFLAGLLLMGAIGVGSSAPARPAFGCEVAKPFPKWISEHLT